MKGLLWVYDGIITCVGTTAVNLSIVPAKQQILKILLIGIKADNYGTARQIATYLHMNPDVDNGIFYWLWDRTFDNEQYVYPNPDEIGEFKGINADRIYLTDTDEIVITLAGTGVATETIRIMVRAIVSIDAKPTLTYGKYIGGGGGAGQTQVVHQNKIRGVIE